MNLILSHHGIYLIEETLAKLEGLGSSTSLPPNQLCDHLAYIHSSGISESLCGNTLVKQRSIQSQPLAQLHVFI